MQFHNPYRRRAMRILASDGPGNAFETTLKVVEPTGDRIIRLPNVNGDVITTGNLTKDGTTTGDPLTGEGDAIAFAIALGG